MIMMVGAFLATSILAGTNVTNVTYKYFYFIYLPINLFIWEYCFYVVSHLRHSVNI